jgi:hypothetical protein
MNQSPIDIFRVERQGVLWVESAATLRDANERIHESRRSVIRDYVYDIEEITELLKNRTCEVAA